MIDRLTFLGGIALVVVGVLIYLPAMRGGWLWDDRNRIIDNVLVHSPDGYWKVWSTADAEGNYYPLSAEVEWLEWRAWGANTLGYHLLSIALHLTSALLLWRLFYRLGLAFAWVGAMLFVVHPLMVESVAWISELKNTLSLPLLLMATLDWLDYDAKGKPDSYRAALIWFALSLAAKTAGLMLPVGLMVFAWWQRGRINAKDIRSIAPFFVLALAAGLITLWPPHIAEAQSIPEPSWTFASALTSVGWTTLFLLGKCLVPLRLMADYPGFATAHPAALDVVPWLILAGIGALLAFAWRRAQWSRPVLIGYGFFLVNLAPALLYVGKNYEEMIWSLDHLVYVPILGLIGASVAVLDYVRRNIPVQMWTLLFTAIGAMIVAFACGTHAYAPVYADEGVFWAYMRQVDPGNWRAQYDSGTYEIQEQRNDKAITLFRKTLELKPDSDQACFSLAKAYEREGQTGEATQSYLQAMKLNPHDSRPYIALAGIMQRTGNDAEAERYLETASAEAPGDSTSTAVLAGLMMKTGRKEEGMELYRKAVLMDPDVEQVRYNYGVALLQVGDFSGAEEQLRAAVGLNGNFAPSRTNLGAALAQSGDVADAIEQFEAAVAINPNYVDARDDLGLALAQTGQLSAAIEQFQTALQINPNDARARESLVKLQSLQAAPAKTNAP